MTKKLTATCSSFITYHRLWKRANTTVPLA